ncbi:MAG: ComF family protein [Actinomycetes bacterium]|nr:ComF family protein [Actinomycetes bacterium]
MRSEYVHHRLWYEAVAELLSPTRCAGCDTQGELFCPACRQSLKRDFRLSQVCPRCAAPYGALVCTECWETDFSFSATVALGVLDGPLARAIVVYKDGGERRLSGIFGPPLARRAREVWGSFGQVVTWVPASARARARRGFDHAEQLARAFAVAYGLPARCLLSRAGARDQRGLSRQERRGNSHMSFRCSHPVPSEVILIDDVFTTGATANAAATALRGAGARKVRLAVLARAWL